MKKNIVCVLLAVIIVAVGYVIYMESHFGTTTVVPVKLSAEQILKEMPSIAFTEEETTMAKELLATQEIEEAFLLASNNENGVYIFPVSDAEKLLSEYTPEGYEVLELAVFNKYIYVSFLSREKAAIYYSFDSNFEYQEKTIGIYGKDLFGERIVKAIYSNINGEITKHKEKRLWFEWMDR